MVESLLWHLTAVEHSADQFIYTFLTGSPTDQNKVSANMRTKTKERDGNCNQHDSRMKIIGDKTAVLLFEAYALVNPFQVLDMARSHTGILYHVVT